MFSRDVLNALLPEGQIWTPAGDDDYDHLLEGIAQNIEDIKSDLEDLGKIRNPLLSAMFEDLRIDYGVVNYNNIDEAGMRLLLKAFMFNRYSLGAYDILQNKLQASGFDVVVIPNYPAIDPSDYYDKSNEIQGDIIVNELEYVTKYDIPVDSDYWSLFFFIGKSVTRDISGNITNIEYIDIIEGQREALKKIILKYKPMHSWGIIVENKSQYLDGTRYLDGTWYLDGFGRDIL